LTINSIMFPVDIFSAYIVCGFGALVAIPMLLMARPEDQIMRTVIRLCVAGALVLGIGLGQIAFAGPQPGPGAQFLMHIGSFLCMPLFALAFARLSGASWLSPWLVGSFMTGGIIVLSVAHLAGGLWLGRSYALISLPASLLMLATVWHFLWQPRHRAEWALGLSNALYALSWLVRCAYTLTYDGPPLAYQLYVPEFERPLFGIFYAILSMLMAALILNLINARLSIKLEQIAATDELTGLLARRAVHDLAARLIARSIRDQRQVAVLVIDLDHFKTINDRHGHLVGDAVLRHTASVLQANVSENTWVGRYGGEEFVTLLQVETISAAIALAERLRCALEQSPCIIDPVGPLRITTSIGVALVAPGESFDDALRRGDDALYRAKRGGRDRVETEAVDSQFAQDGEFADAGYQQ
jgi:diguanylate cyclase (GGDEF)-like protein